MNNADQRPKTPRPERIEQFDLAVDHEAGIDPDQSHASQFVGAELPIENQHAAERGLAAARAALARSKPSVSL